ncbi:MAG: hypothetical protein NTZ93_04455 [Candidatus Beckwithbacteria bacterium]|nr:hypothetical protein [Candidatus Beckwithbacteria bacterium]
MLITSNQFWLQEPPAQNPDPNPDAPSVPPEIIKHNTEWDGKVWQDPDYSEPEEDSDDN